MNIDYEHLQLLAEQSARKIGGAVGLELNPIVDLADDDGVVTVNCRIVPATTSGAEVILEFNLDHATLTAADEPVLASFDEHFHHVVHGYVIETGGS